MSRDIVYTAQARQDLRDIYEYIALELLAPETAAGQTQRIMKMIRSLGEMPMRHHLYEEEPQNTVNIVRIMYGGRDVRRQLNETVL